MGVNGLRKTVTRQRRNCDLNPGHSAPESSTLTTQLPIDWCNLEMFQIDLQLSGRSGISDTRFEFPVLRRNCVTNSYCTICKIIIIT